MKVKVSDYVDSAVDNWYYDAQRRSSTKNELILTRALQIGEVMGHKD